MKIGPMLITHQVSTFISNTIDDRLQGISLFVFNGCGPHGAMTLDSDHHSLLRGAFTAFVNDTRFWLWYTTNILFIQFDNALQ